jgi:hypothetical protein
MHAHVREEGVAILRVICAIIHRRMARVRSVLGIDPAYVSAMIPDVVDRRLRDGALCAFPFPRCPGGARV